MAGVVVVRFLTIGHASCWPLQPHLPHPVKAATDHYILRVVSDSFHPQHALGYNNQWTTTGAFSSSISSSEASHPVKYLIQ